MNRSFIEVESELSPIEDMPAGAELESAHEEDREHVDEEYEAFLESAGTVETPGIEGALEAVTHWRAAKALLVLRKQVDGIAPNRSTASDGTIGDKHHCGVPDPKSDHCPRIRDGNVGVVTAIDITHDPDHGCDADKIAESIRADRDARVKYMIWNRRIASSYPHSGKDPWVWRDYSGSNPHTKHVHISVNSAPAHYNSQDAWSLSELEATS